MKLRGFGESLAKECHSPISFGSRRDGGRRSTDRGGGGGGGDGNIRLSGKPSWLGGLIG